MVNTLSKLAPLTFAPIIALLIAGCAAVDPELESLANEICDMRQSCFDPYDPELHEQCFDSYIELSQDKPDCFMATYECLFEGCDGIKSCLRRSGSCR